MSTMTVSGRRKANRTSFILQLTLRTLAGEARTQLIFQFWQLLPPTQAANLNTWRQKAFFTLAGSHVRYQPHDHGDSSQPAHSSRFQTAKPLASTHAVKSDLPSGRSYLGRTIQPAVPGTGRTIQYSWAASYMGNCSSVPFC